MARERITLLKTAVDIVPLESLEEEILAMLDRPGPKQIVFLSVWDLLRARRNTEYRLLVNNADLVIPGSKSLIRGASFLKLPVPVRYNPFSFIIHVLRVLDNHYKSAYLLGSRKKSLLQAERNVRATFPGIQIVGRYVGFYPKNAEQSIIMAVKKASPSLVLVSNGIPGRERWIYRNKKYFSSSIFLWHRDVLDIFADRKKRVSARTFDRGLEIWPEILKNPFKLFLFFPFIRYLFLLVFYRLFKTDRK